MASGENPSWNRVRNPKPQQSPLLIETYAEPQRLSHVQELAEASAAAAAQVHLAKT